MKVSDVMRRLVEAFGWTFSAELLVPVDGILTPDAELSMILDGQMVHPQPKENLIGHAIDHMVQMMSPKVVQGFQAGQISAESMAMLQEHIKETMQAAQSLLANPQAAAQSRIQEVMKSTALVGGPAEGMPESPRVTEPMGTGAAGRPGMVR